MFKNILNALSLISPNKTIHTICCHPEDRRLPLNVSFSSRLREVFLPLLPLVFSLGLLIWIGYMLLKAL